jgi:hypothetical protein
LATKRQAFQASFLPSFLPFKMSSFLDCVSARFSNSYEDLIDLYTEMAEMDNVEPTIANDLAAVMDENAGLTKVMLWTGLEADLTGMTNKEAWQTISKFYCAINKLNEKDGEGPLCDSQEYFEGFRTIDNKVWAIPPTTAASFSDLTLPSKIVTRMGGVPHIVKLTKPVVATS